MVNNAGIVHPVEVFDTTDEDFATLIDVNLKSTYFGCQAAGERMLQNGGGSIINVATTAVEQGFVKPGSILYCAVKGRVKSMTVAVADLLGPDVRVKPFSRASPARRAWPSPTRRRRRGRGQPKRRSTGSAPPTTSGTSPSSSRVISSCM